MLLTLLLAAAAAPTLVTPAQKKAAETIRAETIRADIRFLSSDLLEGRGPASTGDALAQAYSAARMEAMGLEPGAPGDSFFQPFEIVGIASKAPETLRVTRGSEGVDLRFYEDYVAWSGIEAPQAQIDNAEIVFVGYGIVAPEFQWDDYKGADLKGKVLLVMNNDPESDPKLFAGKTRLYYGRWTYKYEQAARLGAAGAIVIHTTPSAGYKWQVVQTSNTGETFSLPPQPGEPALPVKAWATEDASRRIAKLGGQDLDALRAAAEKRDFRPVPLGVTVSLTLQNKVQRKKTANVIGKLPGSDAALAAEAVLYTAHHDHLGKKEDAKPGEDAIYNGALDNASGVAAMLSVAGAFRALPAPKRTVYFATVAAEEEGLLGSKYLAAHPPVPAGRLAANINIDGMNIWGRTRDLTMIGLGKSSLDDYIVALAKMQGRKVLADQAPDRGFFYRSDQFSFAKVGVPAAYFDAGTDVIGKPPGWGKEQHEKFEATDYHQPSDELRPDWDFSGAIEDAQLYFYLGLRVANAPRMPAWKPGDEFEAARKKAIEAIAPKAP